MESRRSGHHPGASERNPLQGERLMRRRLVSSILCGGVVVLAAACATKDFVRQEVGATERKLAEQMTATETSQDTKLRDTTDRAGESRQAIGQADPRLNGLAPP